MEVVFDADGRPGRHARHGAPGYDGGRAQDGGRGGDATRADPGEAGGENMVVLLSGASDASLHWNQITVSGYCNPIGQPRRPLQATISLSDLNNVTALARGGRGGDGGRGGSGGDGGRGRRGRDATRHSTGGNGGPGGDGGDGGRGSHGGDGGPGGSTRIHIHAKDLYLLTAVSNSQDPQGVIVGGAGGQRGHHGPGGSGGPGGPGGSSYSWTEYVNDTEWYTDGNGNRQTRSVRRAVSRSNSGGWRGSSGTSGWTPNHPLYDGRDGSEGAFVITVTDDSGARRDYARRFDIELADFDLIEDESEEVDGIAEFGEVIHAANIRLRNTGPMPTPKHQRVRLWLTQGPWTSPLGDELYLERSLDPGEEIQLKGSLRFQIREVEITEPGDPFVARQPVRLRVVQLGPEHEEYAGANALFQRDYTARRVERILSAQYPVENRGGIIALRSLAAGERTRLSFDVANISQAPIGETSHRHRKVAVQLELVGGMEPEDVIFIDAEGNEIDLGGRMEGFEGYFVRLPLIEARSHVKVQGQFGFQAGLSPYAGADVRMTIWLEDLHDPTIWRIAQRRQITIRVEPDYVYRPDSKVLLVSNNTTTQEAFLAWRRLLEDTLGLGADFWSISRYGHFDHREDLADGTDLRTHLEDRVALVLNQPFNPRASDQTDLPTDYLKGKDFREGATSNNTHFAVIGSPEFSMRQLLEPTSDVRRGGDDYPSIERFLQKEARTGGPLTQEIFKEDITTLYDVVESHDWTFWGMPDGDALMKKTLALQNTLGQMHPNRRYVLIAKPKEAPERDGRSWLIFPKWSLGQVEVRRTLNTETSAGIVLRMDGAQMQNPAFILGSLEARFAVLLALPFEDKLDRLNWLLSTEPDTLDAGRALTMRALVMALLVDLSEEQSALRSGKGKLTDAILTEKLSNLGRLLGYPLHTQIEAGSNKWDHLIELCAGLEAMAEAHTHWWRFWGRDRTVSKFVLGQLKGLITQLFDGYAVDPTGEVAVDSASARETIDARAEVLAASFGTGSGRGQVAHHHFEHPTELSQGISRDIDVWRDPASRVWTEAELARAQSEEAVRESKQAELRDINARVRAEMLTEAPESAPIPEVEDVEVEVAESVFVEAH